MHTNGRTRLVVKGTPMFPIGLYYFASQMNSTLLAKVGASKFNTIMPYDSGANLTDTKAGQ